MSEQLNRRLFFFNRKNLYMIVIFWCHWFHYLLNEVLFRAVFLILAADMFFWPFVCFAHVVEFAALKQKLTINEGSVAPAVQEPKKHMIFFFLNILKQHFQVEKLSLDKFASLS